MSEELRVMSRDVDSSLITHHSSLFTHHSSLFTHHSSLITHHSSLISLDSSLSATLRPLVQRLHLQGLRRQQPSNSDRSDPPLFAARRGAARPLRGRR